MNDDRLDEAAAVSPEIEGQDSDLDADPQAGHLGRDAALAGDNATPDPAVDTGLPLP